MQIACYMCSVNFCFLQDQKVVESKVKNEQREKMRFLALSDREKRALAAEKRLATQYTQQGQATPVLRYTILQSVYNHFDSDFNIFK